MIKNDNGNINNRLVKKLEQVYSGRPWYGKNIKSIFKLADGPIPHKALVVVNHMIAWRDFVSATLIGKEYKIELNSDKDWPPVLQSSEKVIEDLDRSQTNLIEAILQFEEVRWQEKPLDAKYTFLELCEGVIDHDIYHVGQIALQLKSS